MSFKIIKGKKYLKFVEFNEADGYQAAIAFYNADYKIWYNAASWNKPAKTQYHLTDAEIAELCMPEAMTK